MRTLPAISLRHTPVLLLLTLLIAGCSGSAPRDLTLPPIVLKSTTTTLTATSTTVLVGGSVTLAANVKLDNGSAAAGSVAFNDGSTTLGTATLDLTGSASLTTASLAAGAHTLTAAFVATATEASSLSPAVTVTVTAAPNLAIISSIDVANSVRVGDQFEIRASVAPVTGSEIPTGTVSFLDGTTSIGSANLDLTGSAITTVAKLGLGSHSIRAAYNGDITFGTSNTSAVPVSVDGPTGASYTNPLTLNLSTGGTAVSCADPATIKVQTSGVNTWYLYCTSDALFAGDPATHYINVFESKDLLTWTYDGNAFPGLPTWAPKGPLWAPAIKYFNGEYHLYYASATSNQDAAGGAAIGVGVSLSPKGPFIDHGSPVVEPEPTVGGLLRRSRSLHH